MESLAKLSWVNRPFLTMTKSMLPHYVA